MCACRSAIELDLLSGLRHDRMRPPSAKARSAPSTSTLVETTWAGRPKSSQGTTVIKVVYDNSMPMETLRDI